MREHASRLGGDIITGVRRLPWEEVAAAPMLKAWKEDAGRTFRWCRDVERKTRTIHKRIENKEPLVRTEQAALDWLNENGLSLVKNMTAQSRKAVLNTLHEGIIKGWDIPTLVKRVKDSMMLNVRYAAAVSSRRDMLERQGVDPEKIERDIERYTNKLIRARAENIVRTETVAARNEGRVQAWRDMQEAGELPITARKVWIVGMDDRLCPICAQLGVQKPVLISESFTTSDGTFMRPPAHPSCRCTVSIA